MSLYDYRTSEQIYRLDPPFYALIMAAARKADDDNLALLEQAWPETVAEARERYNAPGGLLDGEASDISRQPIRAGQAVDEFLDGIRS